MSAAICNSPSITLILSRLQETYKNDTPLHLAARRANPLVISYLIEAGCKIGCNQCEFGPSSCSAVDKKVAQFMRQMRTQVRRPSYGHTQC